MIKYTLFLEYVISLLNTTVIKFPRSGGEIKLWLILLILFVTLIVLYSILRGYSMSRKVYNKIKYGI